MPSPEPYQFFRLYLDIRSIFAVWKARFEELGVEHSPIDLSATGFFELVFRDPDNIQLELFAPGT